MVAFQKGMFEKIDISNIMREFELEETEEGLIITNPPKSLKLEQDQ